MYPGMIRRAWIDATRLKLVQKQGKAGFLNTTGINEGSHEKWTKIQMRGQVNQLESHSNVKVTGVTANGELAVGGGFFQDVETRWSDAEGRPLPASADRNVRHAKARRKGSVWASHVRDNELLGGAPSRAARKPQRARARDRSAADVGEPSAEEQIEAALRAVAAAGGSSIEQQQELERIASEVEARVLARRELGEADRATRDAEMEHMVYSQ